MGIFVLVIVVVSGVWGVYPKARESGVLRTQAEIERTDLLERRARLESNIAQLQTDRGLEEALREQYALAERGERLVVIVDPLIPAPVKATSTIRTLFKKIFWWW